MTTSDEIVVHSLQSIAADKPSHNQLKIRRGEIERNKTLINLNVRSDEEEDEMDRLA